jgi:hypothetical protein
MATTSILPIGKTRTIGGMRQEKTGFGDLMNCSIPVDHSSERQPIDVGF